MVYIHQPVKMVGHQAVTQEIGVGQDVGTHLFQEEQVVVVPEKDRFPVVALIVDVIGKARFKVHILR